MKQYSLRAAVPEAVRNNLSRHSEFLQELLYARGIETSEEAETFLNPDYHLHTHNPFLMKNMERAVARISAAMKNNEKIVIYSDYDCDGIPGGVLLHDLFKKIGYENFINYIPHRHEEGYGLNLSAIETCANDGAKLLITVDCGITDTLPVERANELGLDVIITDHHLVPDTPPPAYAILNPKQKGDEYPFDMLCGTGVAFKLAQAILLKAGAAENRHPEWEKWLLDVAGLATIADMVPLIGENRVLARFGLTVLRKSPRPGLFSLCRVMNVKQHMLSEDDIGFMVAPRINAASRMGRPHDAFTLLATKDIVKATELAKHLHALNEKRKGLVASIVREAKKRLQKIKDLPSVLVLGNPDWKPALLGLVANTLVSEYERPVFLWGREGGDTIKGSCRSSGEASVVLLMKSASDLFSNYGGHAFSGGFSMPVEKVHLLQDALCISYTAMKKEAVSERFIDRVLTLDDISWATYAHIEKLSPFGESNPKPVFLFKGIEVENIEQFGKEKNHLRLTFKRQKQGSVSAISFFSSPDQFGKSLQIGTSVDLIASLEKSLFRNSAELRLRILDILESSMLS